MKVLSDGRIISTGRRQTFYPAVPYMFGWMFCIGPQGDSLWYREYTLLNGKYSRNYFYNVIPTNDNGFIACGSVYPVTPDTGTFFNTIPFDHAYFSITLDNTYYWEKKTSLN